MLYFHVQFLVLGTFREHRLTPQPGWLQSRLKNLGVFIRASILPWHSFAVPQLNKDQFHPTWQLKFGEHGRERGSVPREAFNHHHQKDEKKSILVPILQPGVRDVAMINPAFSANSKQPHPLHCGHCLCPSPKQHKDPADIPRENPEERGLGHHNCS